MSVRANTGQRRVAALVAFSSTLSVEAMSLIAGAALPDRVRGKGEVRAGAAVPVPAKENSWEFRESADSSIPLVDVIDRLFERVFEVPDSFVALRNAGCEFKLELVQWVIEADSHDPGFSLDAQIVEFLAKLGAFVDVDQFVG